jgi:hypothetical protein
MADTYTLISSVTVGAGGAATIGFTSIPSTYTDLKLVVSVRTTEANWYSNILLNFNGSSSANYSFLRFIGIGGGTSTDGPFTSQTTIYAGETDGSTATSNTFGNSDIYITNYTGSTYKAISIDKALENNSSSNNILGFVAALWSNTSAINSITLTPASGNFVQYSTAYLYGIKNS